MWLNERKKKDKQIDDVMNHQKKKKRPNVLKEKEEKTE